MIEASFFGLLMAAVGFTMLNQAGMLATFNTAINLSSFTVRADEEDRATTRHTTKALSEWSLTLLIHRLNRTGWTAETEGEKIQLE